MLFHKIGRTLVGGFAKLKITLIILMCVLFPCGFKKELQLLMLSLCLYNGCFFYVVFMIENIR